MLNSLEQNLNKMQKVLEKKKNLDKEILKDLKTEIMNIEEDSRATKLGPNCFIIKSSSLVNNPWSPSYYNVPKQKEIIISQIENLDIVQAKNKLTKIISEGIIKKDGEEIRLNPNMKQGLEKISSLLEEI